MWFTFRRLIKSPVFLSSPTLPMPLSPLARKILDTIRKDPVNWAVSAHITLRPYQRRIALAIKDSVIHRAGRSFVVILPRQSGKNELQAHLFA